MTKRIAVIGAGNLARVRTKALLATGEVTICGIASRTLASAAKFGAEIGCDICTDDYETLAETSPDAVLVEVPHVPQDDAVLWALDQGLHVLVGGCLASSSAAATRIRETAADRRLVVEAGYSCRYSPLWSTAKKIVTGGELGRIAAVRTIALWDGDPTTWYYQQDISGGMPLTHMTYAFINPLRWILGDPVCVSAFANRLRHTEEGMLDEETCVANLLFESGAVGSMTASFICPGDIPGWSLLFLGTEGALEIPLETNTLVMHKGDRREVLDYSAESDSMETQARTFIAALDGHAQCLNTPEATVGDVLVAEAIVASSNNKETVWLRERSETV